MSQNIVLRIECNLKSFFCKRRFPVSEWTLQDFRLYIQQLFDIKKENLIILLHSEELSQNRDSRLLCDIENLYENDTIIIDSYCHVDDIDNVNRLPEKYQMSDKIYSQRKGTLKEYLQQKKIGKYSDHNAFSQSVFNSNKQNVLKLYEMNRKKLEELYIGMHVKVNEPMLNIRYGEIVYIGMLRGIFDEFIGVLFDGPCGDSNGSDGVIQYFDARRRHASFIRPEYIEIITTEEAMKS
ncbi:unnamed protein product [Rotaria magnacalcarata]|uniref:CAP-Gly domain-containing protein n=1 Tax=Rotaria magnacalcarata TaxID=392030 RepID=A0A816PA98_9BILA|nr:unnamed protein product [Rotaria magnacalcarata]CAF2046098.1 unnamed protein product [Rotaria magnacalcarata]CAF3815647.1 unnamed protein product [Rotaria magnacalcarata]CAF3818801.1 unnamed protein product [Rotaria magnacalcarata]